MALQKFGRHTVATLRSEVSSYQDRHNCLEARNVHLQQENSTLRDLCLHLDEQRLTKEDAADRKDISLKYVICPECSSLRNGAVDSSEVSRTETVVNLQNKVQQLEREKDMLHRLLMYGSKNRKEKKRVSFTFPDDDSSSTASELDMFDFPPANFDFTKSNFMSDQVISNGLSQMSNHSAVANSHGSISSVNSISSQPTVHQLDSESAQVGYEHDIHVKKVSNDILHKNTGSISDIGFTKTPNLPPYEESVKYLEVSKGSLSSDVSSPINQTEVKSNVV